MPAATAFSQIGQIASMRRVHAAFQWLHLHEPQIMRWQIELVSIGAPPFGERARAEWLAARFRELGLADVHIDRAGNVIALLAAAGAEADPAGASDANLEPDALATSAESSFEFAEAAPLTFFNPEQPLFPRIAQSLTTGPENASHLAVPDTRLAGPGFPATPGNHTALAHDLPEAAPASDALVFGLDEPGTTKPQMTEASSRPVVLLSAHIDTVFPASTPLEPIIDGTRLIAPGACDNGAGVVALLALAAALTRTGLAPESDIIFLGNVGEEGEGDLRGMRHIYDQAPWRQRIAAHLVLDGAGHEVAVTTALGSRRFEVVLNGPGGHSWTDAGRPNPIVVLSEIITRLARLELSESPRSTCSVGTIEGGTSVNAIAEQARARFDLRSTDAHELVRLEVALHRVVEDTVLAANSELHAKQAAAAPGHRPSRADELHFSVVPIGNRPAGALGENARILELLRAVDRHLNLRTEPRTASTDANIPLSRGVEALSIGAGGNGGGIHTRAEWYDARGRELGLRRVLLLLLALAHGGQPLREMTKGTR